MSQRKTLVITVLLSTLSFVALVGGAYTWQSLKHDQKAAVADGSGTKSGNSEAGSSTTPQSTLNTPSTTGGTLQVDNSTAPSANLGSGQRQTTSSNTVPGPESFAQYDQYKTGSDVMYADLVVGTGAAAEGGKKAALYYKGWLTNGTLFDATRTNDKGELQPFVFTLGSGTVIKGWDYGVYGMKVGGTRRIIIPPSLGYGSTGVGDGVIPPDAVLVFDVQLIAVE